MATIPFSDGTMTTYEIRNFLTNVMLSDADRGDGDDDDSQNSVQS